MDNDEIVIIFIENTEKTQLFISRSIEIHGDLYDYSCVNYIRCKTHVIIKCKTHGYFQQFPDNHIDGHGCKKCYGRQPKTIQDYHQLASLKDLTYTLNTIPNRVGISVDGWTCNKNNHRWKCSYNNIQKGNLCPYCSGKIPKVLLDYQELAKSKRGIYILDFIPRNTHLKINGWKCESNHIWSATYHNINSNKWCPLCCKNNFSKGQIEWLLYLEGQYNISIDHALKNGEHKIENSKYRVDGYHKENNTCYEFHGCYWHGCKKCQDGKKLNKTNHKTFGELYDKTVEKEEYIKSLGYNLIVMWECEWDKIKNNFSL
jgi:hypothetical protein